MAPPPVVPASVELDLKMKYQAAIAARIMRINSAINFMLFPYALFLGLFVIVCLNIARKKSW
jgi:hypothetical protein